MLVATAAIDDYGGGYSGGHSSYGRNDYDGGGDHSDDMFEIF